MHENVNIEMKLFILGNYSAEQGHSSLVSSLEMVWEARGGKTLSPGYLQKRQQLHSNIYRRSITTA